MTFMTLNGPSNDFTWP